MNKELVFSYDEVPYESYNFQNTRPDYLSAVARVFGTESPDFRHAAVLEIGCAAGGNLIPMAAAYPDSRFIGFDLSERQIDEGLKVVADLGLTNIELKHLSIMDVDKSFGTFDYIIVHGIYSWVPDEVQTKILDICSQNLSKTGLAYVSYNTLPGWNMLRTIRDMMIYHSKTFAEPATRIREARQMLDFAIKNSGSKKSPYNTMLRDQAEDLATSGDSYIYHDYLEANNSPCYFHEFMSRANDAGLRYLGDCSLSTMYLGNHAQQAREILGQVDDIVRQEQYMDFLNNRRFRRTVLCHAEIELSRELGPGCLGGLYFSSSFRPEGGLDKVDLLIDTKIKFVNAYTDFSLNDRVASALFCALAGQKNRPLGADELVGRAGELLKDVPEDVVRGTFEDSAVGWLFSDGLEIVSDPGFHTSVVSARPKVWPCSAYWARTRGFAPTVLHGSLDIAEDLAILMSYVDGTRTVDEITNAFVQDFVSGKLAYHEDGKQVTDEAALRGAMTNNVAQRLQYLADRAMLIE